MLLGILVHIPCAPSLQKYRPHSTCPLQVCSGCIQATPQALCTIASQSAVRAVREASGYMEDTIRQQCLPYALRLAVPIESHEVAFRFNYLSLQIDHDISVMTVMNIKNQLNLFCVSI